METVHTATQPHLEYSKGLFAINVIYVTCLPKPNRSINYHFFQGILASSSHGRELQDQCDNPAEPIV